VRKLKEVYQDNRRAYVEQLGLDLYRSVMPVSAAAAGGAAGSGAPAASADDMDGGGGGDDDDDDDDERREEEHERSPRGGGAAAAAAQGLQLSLVPAGPLLPQQRVPVARLLALVPPKRKAAGACCLHAHGNAWLRTDSVAPCFPPANPFGFNSC